MDFCIQVEFSLEPLSKKFVLSFFFNQGSSKD
uniref:Uncharacterized protein n=1 Tax=Physcomitrium patens TaxID=3218 RepID=A0A2K1ISF6_PHYPA|nr:hypothetical protein PHYPA_026328 [Physcomitrium patens]